MSKKYLSFLFALLLLPALVVADEDDEERTEGEEMALTREEVPPRVMAAAKRAKEGAFYSHIQRSVRDDDNTYYTFDASVVGRYFTIVVREDGTVISVEEEGGRPASGNADQP